MIAKINLRCALTDLYVNIYTQICAIDQLQTILTVLMIEGEERAGGNYTTRSQHPHLRIHLVLSKPTSNFLTGEDVMFPAAYESTGGADNIDHS